MNRRAFLQTLGTSLVALNLTLGFRPSTVKAIEHAPAPAPAEDLYRMVVCMKAAEDLEVGDIVVRNSDVVNYVVVDEAAKATASSSLDWFGVVENKTAKGQIATICIRGYSAVRYIGV